MLNNQKMIFSSLNTQFIAIDFQDVDPELNKILFLFV